ncbi:MAG: phosphatidylglycerol lysyltransferase domain-containing protein [Planctomycetes bacterium]|nr:phosphatidylglycerol lysyltransferase domain-containing protein [Planctomycetota bacterium]
MMTYHSAFGIAAGLLSFVAYPIYIADILKGNTKPSKVTWWVLSILNGAIAVSYYAAGGREAIWIPISYCVGFLSVALLSLKYGAHSKSGLDFICLGGAILSIGLWLVLKSPNIALTLLILTDFLGLVPTICKVYREPRTENRLSWIIAAVAGVLNLFAISEWTTVVVAYPLYVAILNLLITLLIIRPQTASVSNPSIGLVPIFPHFKKFELSDKDKFEAFTEKFPPYSDFEFGSLWAWDVKEDMEFSFLNGNLAIRFTDYVSGEPFYTFLGDNKVNETAEQLISLSETCGYGSALSLVPEVAICKLDNTRFKAEETREHFDYLYELEQHVTFEGGKLKSRRNFLNGFLEQNPHYCALPLDLNDEDAKGKILTLCKKWEDNRGYPIPHEASAHARFLAAAEHFNYLTIGITVDSELIAFCTSILLPGGHANGLFEKVDTAYHGIHSLLRSEVAKYLRWKGFTYFNYEQDLGIEGLRQSKMSFNPVMFLKKYKISRIVAANDMVVNQDNDDEMRI